MKFVEPNLNNRARLAPLTKHASQRLQQRGIPGAVLQLLLDFAEPQSAGNGCLKYRFDNETWTEAMQLTDAAAKLDRYRNIFAVVDADDDAVITAGWLN